MFEIYVVLIMYIKNSEVWFISIKFLNYLYRFLCFVLDYENVKINVERFENICNKIFKICKIKSSIEENLCFFR